MRWICLGMFFLSFAGSLKSQEETDLSNLRVKILDVVHPKQVLDSLTIIPNSFKAFDEVTGESLDSSKYTLENYLINWSALPENLPQRIRVEYRVFPFDFFESTSRFDTIDRQKAIDESVIGFEYNPFSNQANPLINFKGLNYTGSFARGISFGNNQDLVLNSSFNLQLAGKLGDDVEILAAITDENIPIQPEGNTQQLREFDRIFVQIKKGDNKLIAGDYELRRPNSYFMNYLKKLQGATFSNKLELSEGLGTIKTSASIAISRGKFARNNIIQQEGNQGPYRLEGNGGERFIIVLAGTEKVFLDGQLVKRGIEQDYIIDYNRGEVTFTNKQLITKDSRIIVEFEYSEQDFNRSLYAINSEYLKDGFRFYANIYSEQDGRNTAGNQVLTADQKRQLSLAGDSFQSTFVSSVRPLEENFDELRPTYALKDSITSCGIVDSILVFNGNSDEALVTARFTFVGQGNGTYVIDNAQRVNERIYKWVGLDSVTCLPRGDFEPVIQLSAPQKQQLITLGTDYAFNKKRSKVSAEIAFSEKDENRFSRLDREDDRGMAFYTTFQSQVPLKRSSDRWMLDTDLQYEFKAEHFNPLNPYRSAEFLRDWNLTDIQGLGNSEQADEHLARVSFAIVNKDLGLLKHEFSTFYRDSVYTGFRNATLFQLTPKNWDLTFTSNYLTTQEINQNTIFFRPKIRIVKDFEQLGGWSLAFDGEREQSSRKDLVLDTLKSSSFFYDRVEFQLSSPTDKKGQLNVSFNQRVDYRPAAKQFLESARAEALNVNGQWRPGKGLNLKGNVTYRQLEVGSASGLTAESGQTILGRTDLNTILAKGAIRSVSTYEIGSGQEPRLEFSFVRVAQGQGTHIWLDSLFNNDGIIQPIEMEVAPFQDIADFIRINTFTNDFIRTNNVLFNQSLQLNPKAIWFSKKGIQKFLARFSTQTTLKIIRKTREADGIAAWNPFQLAIADTALVSVSSSIRNIIFFNRGNAAFDIQIGQTDNRNKIVQTTGFESRKLSEYFLKYRVNFSKTLSSELEWTLGSRASDSEFFDTRDYNIRFLKISPELTYLPVKNLRFALRYKFQNDENLLIENGEKATQHDFNLELAYNQSSKTTIRSRFSWIQIDFKGETNSPVGFAILNGLQDGRNFLWNLSLDRQIARNIRLNISYDGRKTGTNRIIHVGRAQVAAVF